MPSVNGTAKKNTVLITGAAGWLGGIVSRAKVVVLTNILCIY